MEDRDWQKIMTEIKKYQKIRIFMIFLCYTFIICALLFYIIQFFAKNDKIHIINKSNQNSQISEKIMLNPSLKFAYEENKIMLIKAKQALYKKDAETTLQQVFAESEIGNITAGKLVIHDAGNYLIFSENPMLIINQYNYE
jgi:hypothetical protein